MPFNSYIFIKHGKSIHLGRSMSILVHSQSNWMIRLPNKTHSSQSTCLSTISSTSISILWRREAAAAYLHFIKVKLQQLVYNYQIEFYFHEDEPNKDDKDGKCNLFPSTPSYHSLTLLSFFRSLVVVCQVSPPFQYTFPISPNFNSIPLSLPFLLQELGSGHNINRLMQISNLLNTLQKCHRNEASAMPINSPYSWIYSGCLSETRRVLGNELALTKAKFCGWNWNCGQCFIFMPHFWPVLYRRLPRPIPSQILVVILSKFI